MLNELFRWMSDKKTDRRATERKRVQFPIGMIRGDEIVSGVGTEISLNGLFFATKTKPPTPSFNVVMDVAGKRIRARLATVRTESAMRENQEWHLVAATFEGIAADDYDAIVRFVKEMPEPENKAQSEIAKAAAEGDNAYRLLPMPVQKKIVDQLISGGRLAPGSDPRNPLLRMNYLGSKNGKHRFAVHSRKTVADEIRAYDSLFIVDDDGGVLLEN
jgi:hypothetical protein